MRTMLIRIGLILLVVVIGWLAGGRQLVLLLDRFVTIRMAALPATPIRFESGRIEIAGRPLETGGPGDRSLDLQVRTDAEHRVVLTRGPNTITLGRPGGAAERAAIAPDEGDDVRFTLDRSAISWPTPLEMNFMTGHAPSWKRNLYFRLLWAKRSGERLRAVWRYEQWYYPSLGGWSGQDGMMNGKSTGLIELTIE
jgi:hypothetical protein